MIRYLTIEDCKREVFTFIQAELTADEQAADYEHEPGMAELQKVLTLMQADEYYPTFEQKAAYLLCSIAGSQYFSNGNKRLSVVTLLTFLIFNEAAFSELSKKQLEGVFVQTFPLHVWEENPNIRGDHSLFLYNLAIVLGNRACWGTGDFGATREKVGIMFGFLYWLPSY